LANDLEVRLSTMTGVIIRRAEPADADRVQAIYAPIVSKTAISFETTPPDVPEIGRRIEAQAGRYPWLLLESGPSLLGYAYASSHRTREAYQWCVDVSVYVDPRYHRRGVGRALYAALLDLLRRQGFVNAYAGIALPNPSSVALHESFGFEEVGTYRRVGFKLGRWHDVLWLHLRLLEAPDPERAPLPTEHLWNDRGVAELLGEHARSVRVD
jgi:L-amino acid N-acyltransferase YncA